ncbi:MAG: bifunctional phosphoribosyl-AMP cyclohydrolase/phosphoribosyl-ATP diphosphatase HisIE [Proteobacteria bacterium]|nr:bifunctional phosphoribosyl-AMP cyclohydrolase/phosphoribosyl-ATP diphosphatase HisIE [Pseudomonadota bacterium]
MNVSWDDKGLIPAVVQHAHTGEVLTVAYMNAESLQRTLETGQTWFWSRSRSELWNKGATSGNTQRVIGLGLDCDGDALVVQVEPAGPACHTGEPTCFFNPVEGGAPLQRPDRLGVSLAQLQATIAERARTRPEGSYTIRLLDKGAGKIAQKVGEEASEVIVAALTETDDELAGEVADLLYHLTVLLQVRGLNPDAVADKLEERRK